MLSKCDVKIPIENFYDETNAATEGNIMLDSTGPEMSEYVMKSEES